MTNPLTAGNKKGFVLMGVIMLIAMLAIVVPALVFLAQQETHSTVKSKKSMAAYFLAEAGVERSLWELQNSSVAYENVLSGNVPDGYRFDVSYTDVKGGQYRIQWSTTSIIKQLKIISTGRDSSAKEFRTIEVILMKNTIVAAIQAGTIDVGGKAQVYWGPLMALGSMHLSGNSNEFYPRKYSRGAITASGGGSYPTRDDNPDRSADGNTDTLEWWSYNEPPGVPNPPKILLNEYRLDAQAQTRYYATDAGTISNFEDTNEDAVYFFEDDVKFTGTTHFRGILIVMGDLAFGGGASNLGEYTVTPPEYAYLEYAKNCPDGGEDLDAVPGLVCNGGGDGANDDGDYDDGDDTEADNECWHQYPGDKGLHVVEPFTFGVGCVDHSNFGGGPNNPVTFKGFIYINGSTKLTGTTVIHGAVYSKSGQFTGGGGMVIFFNDDLEVKGASEFNQISWQELAVITF